MPNIKLYTAKLSPPGRAVELTAKLLGLQLDIVPINLLAGDHRKDEFLKMNPQHTIPVIDDDGVIVRDSHAIIIYLVLKYGPPDHSLYPEDAVTRAKVNAGLHFDSGVLFSRLRFYFEPILYEGSSEVPQHKIEYMQKGYELLNDALVEDYMVGNTLTLADVSCIATIATMEEFFPMDRSKYPALVGWIERLSRTLPAYEQLNQEGAVEFAEICESLRLKNAIKAK
uniref:glutathione transferase n=1 Tax=Anopheles stephensi TaxID=30069 RepID=A0A182YT78_ANOST